MKLSDEIREFFSRQGARGGKARARTLSPEQRSEIARKAVQTRWAKAKTKANAKEAVETSVEPKPKRGGKR